jgi:hypothetical protein
MKKDMCESCYYSEIKIVDGYSKYPFLHKCKILTKYCFRNSRNVKLIVSLEDSKQCGYKMKAGKIDKKTTQNTLL